MSFYRVVTAGLVLGAAAIGVVFGAWIINPGTQAAAANQENAIPGLCMLSRDAVLDQSKVGQVATRRLQQLTKNATDQIKSENNSLAASANELNNKKKSHSKDERDEQRKKISQQTQQLQQKARMLDARVRYTRDVVKQRLNEVIDPLINDRYKAHGCSVLLNRNNVLKGDDTNDLTASVTAALDDKVTKINFDLLALPQQTSTNGTSGQ